MITNVYIDTRYPGKIIKEYIAEGRNLESLYELIDDGYSFKERKKAGCRTYTLQKEKKSFFNSFTL